MQLINSIGHPYFNDVVRCKICERTLDMYRVKENRIARSNIVNGPRFNSQPCTSVAFLWLIFSGL